MGKRRRRGGAWKPPGSCGQSLARGSLYRLQCSLKIANYHRPPPADRLLPNPVGSTDAAAARAARADRRGKLKKAGIDQKISPNQLRDAYANNLLNAGAERVDIQALLGHVNLATTQIYTHVDQDRRAAVVM